MTNDPIQDADREADVKSGSPLRHESDWRSPAAVIALLSVVLSLAALGVSVRGCAVSQRALELSAKDFQAARAAVYQASVNAANDELLLTPIDSGVKIQEGAVYFPPQVDKTVWPISPPGFGLSLAVLRDSMQKVLGDRFPRRKGYVQVVDQASVPFIIDSSYIAKNEPFRDRSMYELKYMAIVWEDELKRPDITFKGISFLQRLPPETEPNKYLEAVWKSGLSETMQSSASH